MMKIFVRSAVRRRATFSRRYTLEEVSCNLLPVISKKNEYGSRPWR